MAKPKRAAYVPVPLSSSFFALLTRVGKRHRLAIEDDDALVHAVAGLSRAYTRARDQLSVQALGEAAELARLGFFLARDLPKVFGPLHELWVTRKSRWAARPLRVLDIGAGLGTTSLGIARYLRLVGASVPRLEVHAVERDGRALALFRSIADGLDALPDEFVPLRLCTYEQDARDALPDGVFDLVVCGLVLNEIADATATHAQMLLDLTRTLAPDGALIVIEPAAKASARALMATRDALLAADAGLHIVAPCVHREACPMLESERDWCHEELPFALSGRLAAIATQAGLRYEGLSYAALVITRDAPPTTNATRYRVVSDPLPSKGKHEVYGCAEHGYVRLGRLLRHESARNRMFDQARRGDRLTLPNREPRVDEDTDVLLEPGPRQVTSPQVTPAAAPTKRER